MIGNSIFTKQQFADFIVRHCEQQLPELRFGTTDDPFRYNLTNESSEPIAVINLHNVWTDYRRTGDMNVIIDYLNHQCRIFQFASQAEKDFKGPDLANIFPVIRPHHFRKSQGNGEDFLHDEQVPGLDSLFIEDQGEFVVFLTKEYVKPAMVSMNEYEIMQRAYDNLRERGWNPEQFRFPAPSDRHMSATFHVYMKTYYPYQHQFFLPDMAGNHLPPTFLAAVPSRDTAVILTLEEPLPTAYAARKAAAVTGFRKFVEMCFLGEPRPISRNIYWIQEGRISRL